MENDKLDTSNVRDKEDLPAFIEEVGNSPSIEEDIDIEIMSMKDKYDEEHVDACPVCNSLYLLYNDNLSVDCMNCGNEVKIKDLVRYESIYSYIEKNESNKDTN